MLADTSITIWSSRYRMERRKRWLGGFGQGDKWIFCLRAAQSPFAKARGGWFDGLILAYWAAF
jgi:hypothetical protein